MDSTKKQWSKPVLIVIGRARPEESVLTKCKTSGAATGSFLMSCISSNSICESLQNS